jgi:transcriptional regulator with GAF, ATPase, and Fis domain
VDKTKPGSPGAQGEPSAQDTGSTNGQDELAMRLSDLARDLQRQEDPHDTLLGVVRAAVELIPGVEEGSISVVLGRREVRSEVPSGELPRAVDAVQNEVGQGPCLDAAFKQQTVRVTDMSREQRWPKFAARALEAGAASMLSFQLYVEGDNLGALNLYSSQPNAFDDESEHVGLLFASHAAIAYAAAQKHSGLQQAVATRQLIGQAQGILMERHKITGDQAFALLVRHSQQENIKLRELSERLVRSGELGRT